VLVENHFVLQGETRYIGSVLQGVDGAPIKLQAAWGQERADQLPQYLGEGAAIVMNFARKTLLSLCAAF